MNLTESDKFRFWSKVKINSADQCWPWIARSKFRDGYGAFKVKRKQLRASRISYTITKGQIIDGLCVIHTCDNPSCCNPNHLLLATQSENIQDMCRKQRQARGEKSGARLHPEKCSRGELHGQSKLKDAQVQQIRNLGAQGINGHAIASKFNVSYRTIRYILSGKTWRHTLPTQFRVGNTKNGLARK